MHLPKLIVFGAVAVLIPVLSPAQSPSAIQQADSVQQRRETPQLLQSHETGESAPELFPGEAGDVGPQSVLQTLARRTHFEAFADVQYFYTDNMFLADGSKISSDVLVSTVRAALAPTPYELFGGSFSPRLGYRHEWFNFGLARDEEITVFNFDTMMFEQSELSDFDFNVQTVFTDGQWRSGNWVFGAGFDFRRLLDMDYEQFYREYVPRWGLWRVIPVCEASALSVGYEGDYRFTDTDLPPPVYGSDFSDRTDHSLVANYSYVLCEHAVIQPYYRFQYTHYTAGESRDDYLNSFGLGLYMPLTKNVSIRTFVSYSILETSSSLVSDYCRFDAGGGINLNVRF